MKKLVNLQCTIDYLEDAFYSLNEVAKICPRDDENYEIIINAIEELSKCHNTMIDKLENHRE